MPPLVTKMIVLSMIILTTKISTYYCDIPAVTVPALFYDRSHSLVPVNLQTANMAVLKIDASKPFKVLCHGWINSAVISWYKPTIVAYLQKGYNVIAIDWSKYSFNEYLSSVSYTKDVGKVIGNLLLKISNYYGVSLKQFHCVGHSLGAHITGFAGKTLQAAGKRLGRISGLDPAGPSYNEVSASERLDKEDASFVDIIHTNFDLFGIKKSIGHVDFWPNGGASQVKTCSILILVACSHNVAPIYFTESIYGDDFVATKCSSYEDYEKGACKNNRNAVMGEDVNMGISGDFYLNINVNVPYAQG